MTFNQKQFVKPPLRDRFLKRSAWTKKMSCWREHTLTLVHAGAGFGKSTSLSLFAEEVDEPVCWYRLEEKDDSLLFIKKLTYAVQQQFPLFGEDLLDKMSEHSNEESSSLMKELADLFVEECLSLEEPFLVILDDFHFSSSCELMEEWMDVVLEHPLPNVHFIISTRNKPEWGKLSSLYVKGELLSVSWGDFRFSSDEMEYLLEEELGRPVDNDYLDQIEQLTEGWPVAFHLVLKQVGSAQKLEDGSDDHDQFYRYMFQFLEEEVFTRLEEDTQNFLLKIGILRQFSATTCTEIFGTENPVIKIENLYRSSLFIAGTEEGTVVLHKIFHAFLEERYRNSVPDAYAYWNERAGMYFWEKGDKAEACLHFKKIKSWNLLATLLEKEGLSMIRSGELESINSSVDVMPPMVIRRFPMLLYLKGEIERYRSDYLEAENNFNQIIQAIPEYDDEQKALLALAFEGKARIYLDTIQPGKAERFVKQAIHFHEQGKSSLERRARLYQVMAENLLNLGHAIKSESWYENATELGLPIEEGNLQARIYLRTGRLDQAQELLLKQKEDHHSFDRHKKLPEAHRETDLLLSYIYALKGEVEESRRLAEKSIRLGEEIKSPFIEACGWMRKGHALQVKNSDSQDAVECYEKSLQMMDDLHVSRGKAEPLMGLALMTGKQRHYEAAMSYAKHGLLETEQVSDHWLSAWIKMSYALIELNSNAFASEALFIEVEKEMKDCGDSYGQMISLFWQAYIAMKTEKEWFIDRMESFIGIMQHRNYLFFMKQRTIFGPVDLEMIHAMLKRTVSSSRCSPAIKAWISKIDSHDGSSDYHPGYTLVVRTFGGFSVSKGYGEPVIKDWQREKAKEMFALFVSEPFRLFPKEEIIESLWPEETEHLAAKKFKVTFHTLLKVIEPERKPRRKSHFILVKGGLYGLHPHSGWDIDAVDFKMAMEHKGDYRLPLMEKKRLEEVVDLYRGDFLSDLDNIGWVLEKRRKWRESYLRKTELLAQLCVRLEDFEGCIEYCERILSEEVTWEEAYRLMMFSYYKKNNRPQAIKWYERCLSVLKQELGIVPLQSTHDMYYLIMEDHPLRHLGTT